MNGENEKLFEQDKNIHKIGRLMVPFSQHKNKRHKVRQAYNMICQLGGSTDEAANLINELHEKVNPTSNRTKEVNQIIVENLRWILDHHPEPRPFRAVLASLVTRDVLTLEEASKATGVPSSTISFHNQRSKEELVNALVYRITITREKIPNTEMKWVSSWIEVHAPVRSGTINKRRWIFGTLADMYECYKKDAVSAHFPIRSKSFVINLSYKPKIKVPKYDRYVCPKCFSSPHQSPPQIDSEHSILVNSQYSWYIHLLNNLQPNQCVIVQDYTTIHEELNKKTRILNFAVTTAETRENSVYKVTRYYDFIGHLKQSSQYTQSVWNYFLTKYHFSQFKGGIYIWSDTAFRKKSDLSYFRTLAKTEKIPITCNFFAPYHGHSSCDQHFGHVKQKLRRQNLNSRVTSLEQIRESSESVKNTTTFLFSNFNEHLIEAQPKPRFSERVKRFHEWIFTTEGKVLCKERSGEGEYKENNIF